MTWRLGFINNPLSGSDKKGALALEQAACQEFNLVYHRLEDFALLPRVLQDFAAQGVDVIIVGGGDGTVQAVLTTLYTQTPFKTLPTLAVLPRGTTNMIADDVGLKGKDLAALRRLEALGGQNSRDQHLVTRRILCLENAEGFGPQYGMFFGGAGITQAIEICREKVHKLGVKAGLANFVTLTGLVGGWLLGRRTGDGALGGHRLEAWIDGEARGEETCLLILATTLDRLALGSRPFWNSGEGALRYTSIAHPPRALAGSVLKVLYGGPERRLPVEGYFSCGAAELHLRVESRFTLDGQLFSPHPEKLLRLTAAQEMRFVRI